MRCGTRTIRHRPLNVHKDGSTVRVQVQSVSFFQRAQRRHRPGAGALPEGASAPAGGADERFTHWIATIQYAFTHAVAGPAGAPLESARLQGHGADAPSRRCNAAAPAGRGG